MNSNKTQGWVLCFGDNDPMHCCGLAAQGVTVSRAKRQHCNGRTKVTRRSAACYG